MDRQKFEDQLKADGFQEIESKELAPRDPQGRHRHPFEVRGMVLSGNFSVAQTCDFVVYDPGEIYSVAEGELHDESIGPEGAKVVYGRRFSDPEKIGRH